MDHASQREGLACAVGGSARVSFQDRVSPAALLAGSQPLRAFDPKSPVYHCDFETRSTVDIRASGARRYAEDPSTEVLCLSYQLNDGPVFRWRPGQPFPQDLHDHLTSGGTLGAHNSSFERFCFNIILPRQCPNIGWPVIQIEQCDCTLIRGLALSFPASLDQLGEVLRLKIQKDKSGSVLMRQMCRPRKPRKGESKEEVLWIEDDASMQRLQEYCDIDVLTENAAGKKLLPLSAYERKLWHLTERMNDRGVCLDLRSARKLMAIARIVIADGDARMAVVTKGAVTACTQAGALAGWIRSHGIPCESVGKDEIDDVLKNARWCGLDDVIEAIELRREFAKASTSKIKTMFACVCADGRAHDQIQYHGASTGRDAGRLIQMQNLPRVDEEKDLPLVKKVFEILDESGTDVIRMVERIKKEVGKVLPLVSKCLRGLLIASAGYKFVGGDLSNIEGRGAAWLCGAEKKLEMFRQVDAGILADPYIVAYAETFNVPLEQVTGEQRQIGKIQELALGYQGSLGAILNFASDKLLATIADLVKNAVDEKVWDAAWTRFEKRKDHFDLTQGQWTAIRVIVDGWRASELNAPIVQGWYDLQDAAIEAVENPGRAVPVFGGKVVYKFQNSFLWCRLPSGRVIAYFNPAVAMRLDESIICEDGEKRDVEEVPSEELARLLAAGAEISQKRGKKVVEFEGYRLRKKGGQKEWVERCKRRPGEMPNLSLYGGLQLENIDQGMCADLMHEGCLRSVDVGFFLVMKIHDEQLTEAPLDRDDLNAELLTKCMTDPIKWAPGFPLSAKCFEDVRY